MIIPLHISIIGELDSRTNQAIAIAKQTSTNNPVVQSTTIRETGETDESFVARIRCNIRTLIAPFGYEHRVVLHCRETRQLDYFSNDEHQNITRKLWHIANNSPNQGERVKALIQIYDMYSTQ